jgi:hypothetical protein
MLETGGEMSEVNLHTVNIAFPLLFLFYQIVIDFVDLFPFNDIHSRDNRLRKYEVLGNYPSLLLISFCFYYHSTVSMWIGFVVTSIILVMHLFAWWIPYFFGFPNSAKNDYLKYFSRTYKFLPRIKDHIVPDAEHVGVGILLVVTLLFQAKDLFQ